MPEEKKKDPDPVIPTVEVIMVEKKDLLHVLRMAQLSMVPRETEYRPSSTYADSYKRVRQQLRDAGLLPS